MPQWDKQSIIGDSVFSGIFGWWEWELGNSQLLINIQVNNYEEPNVENISFLLLKQP